MRLVHRGHRPLVAQRHRPGRAGDHRRVPSRTPGQVVHERGDVAERRRHQQELRVRQLEDRHLPRPATVGLGVEVELVHHHLPDVRVGSLAQGDVGQHLRRAAHDRRLGVDRRVTGQHPDVLGTEDVDQGEELLRDERLDRGRVEGPLPLRQCGEVRAGGDQALPGPGRCRQDDVGPADQLDQRLLLRRVERQALLADPGLEDVEERVGVGRGGETVEEWHRPVIVPDRALIAQSRRAPQRPKSAFRIRAWMPVVRSTTCEHWKSEAADR